MGNQIIIVVYDTDEEYITGINEYLLDYINERYSIFTFSNVDKFREFCEMPRELYPVWHRKLRAKGGCLCLLCKV